MKIRKIKVILIIITSIIFLGGCQMNSEKQVLEEKDIPPITGKVSDGRECKDMADLGITVTKDPDNRYDDYEIVQEKLPGISWEVPFASKFIDLDAKKFNTNMVENYLMCRTDGKSEWGQQSKDYGYNVGYGLYSERNAVLEERFAKQASSNVAGVSDEEVQRAVPAIQRFVKGYIDELCNGRDVDVSIKHVTYDDGGEEGNLRDSTVIYHVNATGDMPEFDGYFSLVIGSVDLSENPTIYAHQDPETQFYNDLAVGLIIRQEKEQFEKFRSILDKVQTKYNLEITKEEIFPKGLQLTTNKTLGRDFVNGKDIKENENILRITLWLNCKDKNKVYSKEEFKTVQNEFSDVTNKIAFNIVVTSDYYMYGASTGLWSIAQDSIDRIGK